MLCLPMIGRVPSVNVRPVSETSVLVVWRKLDTLDVTAYNVYFTLEGEEKKREVLEDFIRVESPPAGTEPSVVVGGLDQGGEYRFEVVPLVFINGAEREGQERSEGVMIAVEGLTGTCLVQVGVV